MFLKRFFENNLENDFFMKITLRERERERERGFIDEKHGCVNILIRNKIHHGVHR